MSTTSESKQPYQGMKKERIFFSGSPWILASRRHTSSLQSLITQVLQCTKTVSDPFSPCLFFSAISYIFPGYKLILLLIYPFGALTLVSCCVSRVYQSPYFCLPLFSPNIDKFWFLSQAVHIYIIIETVAIEERNELKFDFLGFLALSIPI